MTAIAEERSTVTTAAVAKRGDGIAIGDRGLRLTTLGEAYRFAQYVIASGLAPKGVTTAEQALIAMQAGAELGFSPMRALACVTVINGRAGLMGDAALAKIHESGVCSKPPVVDTIGEGDSRKGLIRFQRKDMTEPIEITFSVADAKKAQLWGKAGPWTQYSDDMLIWRAVGRAGKRYFGDVLMGLVIAEELQDYPAETTRLAAPPAGADPLLEEVAIPLQAEAIEAEVVAPESPKPVEQEQPTIDAREFVELVKALESSAVALFGKSRAKADAEVSAATSGKIQSILSLSKATNEQLGQIERHFEAIANEV